MNIEEEKTNRSVFSKYTENIDMLWDLYCWLLLHFIQEKYPTGAVIFFRKPNDEAIEINLKTKDKSYTRIYSFSEIYGKEPFDPILFARREATIFRDIFDNLIIKIKAEGE